MRATWGSKIGFILATAGSAIGLGNIWRFPYLIAQNGGFTFLLIYLLCVFGLGYFLLTAKITFGHIAQTNFIDGFQKVATKNISPLWSKVGGSLTLFNIFFVSSVYIIVIGWTLSYMVTGFRNLLGISPHSINASLFQELTSSYSIQFFWILLCLFLAGFILVKGIKGGIEKVSLYLMPCLFCLLLIMVGWIFFIPNTHEGLSYLFKPQWGFSNWHQFAQVALQALGQAIYSLSLGLGVCFIYGSYLKPDVDIKKSALWVTILDTMVAVLASMIVLPSVFAFHLESAQGPALSFITLPFVFSKMAGGNFLMGLFFTLLFLGALTSLISIYEPAINLIMEKCHFNRKKATFIVLGINLFLSLITLASFTGKIDYKINNKNLFDFIDYLTGTYTLGLMILVYSLFMGWKIYPQLSNRLQNGKIFNSYFRFVLKWIIPIILISLFISA